VSPLVPFERVVAVPVRGGLALRRPIVRTLKVASAACEGVGNTPGDIAVVEVPGRPASGPNMVDADRSRRRRVVIEPAARDLPEAIGPVTLAGPDKGPVRQADEACEQPPGFLAVSSSDAEDGFGRGGRGCVETLPDAHESMANGEVGSCAGVGLDRARTHRGPKDGRVGVAARAG
jgi:hypothetical protein